MIFEQMYPVILRYLLFLVSICALFLSDAPSYGYNSSDDIPITVLTDRREYHEGDTLVISGSVRSFSPQAPLTLEVFDPDKNLIHITQLNLSQDGSYAYNIKIGGYLWKKFGSYTVRTQYGFHSISNYRYFDLAETTQSLKQTFRMDAGNEGLYNIPYTIMGGRVNYMKIDYASLMLYMSINATSNGSIKLDIPRSFMDAKRDDGSDEKFIILVNGSEIRPFLEEDGAIFRNVTINFLPDDSEIELIGTHIVPEFAAVSQSILLISIISGIILTGTIFGRRFSYPNVS